MHAPVKALLVETTNPLAGNLRGRTGDLYCEVGVRCIFEGLLTSAVEGIVWFGRRLEVHTRNSRYLFELCER
ncbi:MAG: hypothetical protein ACREQ9_12795 [Candidatus Binatia bacterium]